MSGGPGPLRDSPRLCLCLTGATVAADLRTLEDCRAHVDMVELRADCLSDAEVAAAVALPRRAGIPAILTARRRADGGEFAGTEADRRRLLSRLLGAGFDFVDLEEDLVAPDLEALAASRGTRVIRSLHDLRGVPADLARRVRGLPRSPGELPRAAVMTRGTADLARLLRACGELADVDKIVLGMGDFGFASRVLAAKLGSRICYSPAPGSSAAPGQGDPRTLDTLFRFHGIDRDTAVFGVIGNPVMHSLSPLIHNRGLAAAGLNAVYLPFPVDDLAAFWDVAGLVDIRGLSVTAPWKEAVIPFLARRDPLVDAVGACNTLVRMNGAGEGERGGWEGTNTDVEGFLAPLREAFGGTIPRGLRATVIGAGGASRAVLHALASQGAEVLLLNRTLEKARALARGPGVHAARLDEGASALARGYGDLIVQATSAGMGPAIGIDPFPGYQFTGRELVYEMIYAPPTTAFLARAQDAGCRVVPGIRMLLAQARAQFRSFLFSRRASRLLDREKIHDTRLTLLPHSV